MKGVVFNALEEFTDRNYGEDQFQDIVEECHLETKDPFVGPGTYPDSDLMKIVSRLIDIKKVKLDWALKEFGHFLFPKLISINESYASESKGIIDFLQRVDSIIHIEVKKLFEGAITPTFIYSEITETSINIKYISNRQLCFLMEGLILGASEYLNERIDYKQLECHHEHGCDYCLFQIKKV